VRSFRPTWRQAVVIVAAGALAPVTFPATGQAQPIPAEPDHVVVEDGRTQPVFNYANAVREVIQVTSPVSSHDGDEPDMINVDIIRPAASDGDLQVPTIIIPSPYYSGPGRGRQGERKPTPPATPSVIVGDQHLGGALMDGSAPLTGQAGHLVDCGLALSPEDCPEGTDGTIALIERDPDAAQTANLAATATASCSYTSPWENCSAINDGIDPPQSNDGQNPRWGTWPEGGDHWIELAWDEPQEISVSDIYWLQDSADGSNSGVKRPAEWSTQYWDGAQYVDVANPSGYGTALDQYNRTTFDQITTTRLRANVETRTDAVGVGALEWRVYTQAPTDEPTQAENAAAAGAIGAVVYNNTEGTFTGTAGDATIPALAVSRSDGLVLLDLVGEVDANLRELVDPIDFFPLYYDNVFVPRGYAVAQVDLPGSRYSTGCLDVGGPAEVGATEAVVNWLAGEGHAVDGTTGQQVTAHWSNGLSALTGKSWDGTIPIAVAERAPEGLATIVPIAGLSHWQSDFWQNGARYGGSPTLWHDGNNNNPAMAGYCTQTRSHLAANQEDPDPASDFWLERNWIDEVGGFDASVFVVHGMNDDNVKPVNFGRLYDALREHDKPRKMWLSQVEHQKAFDFRRDEWLDEIHRWYDYWLQGVDNGIVDEPRVDVEHAPGEWTRYDDWPNGTGTRLWLGTPREADDPRLGTLWPDARYSTQEQTASFHEVRRNQTQLVQNPFQEDDRRLAFLSPELSEPVHISGQPTVTVQAQIDGEQATLSAFLVDYGTAERVQYGTSGGIVTFETETCFGGGSGADTGCYFDVGLRTHTTDVEAFTRGWVHAGFHLGLDELDPAQTYQLTWGLQDHDYVFEAGHRIGVVIAGPESNRLQSARHPTTNNEIEIDLVRSQVDLPVVGGLRALQAAFGWPGSPD
jgi:X-Pro dipeptidyl-peptidase